MTDKAWIDIKGHISIVTNQEGSLDDDPWAECQVKAGDEWWGSTPGHAHEYPEDEIAQSNVHLLVLGSVADYSDLERYGYGALVLQRCGWDDDRPCFRRLGIAYLGLDPYPATILEYGPLWEFLDIRLI